LINNKPYNLEKKASSFKMDMTETGNRNNELNQDFTYVECNSPHLCPRMGVNGLEWMDLKDNSADLIIGLPNRP